MTDGRVGPVGPVAVVTGVSRSIAIGAAITRRLLADGWSVLATGWSAHDAEMAWGADPDGGRWLAELGAAHPERLDVMTVDLADPSAPDAVVADAIERFGRIDAIVANHARSSHGDLATVTAEELDACWAVNARASVLLAQSLLRRRPAGPDGRLVLFTSGQHQAPMGDEIAYAVSKGAIHQMTASLADQLIDHGVTVNAVNPGPVDTGWAAPPFHDEVRAMFPAGRWGQPSDVANLVAWLVSPEAAWITGQVIDSEGGFRRGARPDPDRRDPDRRERP